MALTANYIDRRYYGTSGNTYYYRLIRRVDQYIWDVTNSALAAVPVWANTKIAMTEVVAMGQFPILIPVEAGLPLGYLYDVVIYLQAGGTPAVTDTIQDQFEIKIGERFGF